MALKALGGVFAASGIGGYVWARQTIGEDGLDRIVHFDKVAIPIVLDYKWEEAKCEKLPKILPSIFRPVPEEEQNRRFKELHLKHAKPLFDVYMELGGFYYKNGQKVASNMSGVAPKIYQDMFQPFLNDIPARPKEEVRKLVEAELGRKREEVFATWDDEPIGCASIGQVHRATLKTTGERVVVKVQNPDAERTFVGDVLALKVLVDVFMPQLSPAFSEIEKQFATEFDYRGECINAIEIRKNLKDAFPNIIVPYVYEDLCSKRLMVMEEVSPSTPLHNALDEQALRIAKSKGMTKEEFMDEEKRKLEEETQRLAKEGKVKDSVSADDYQKYIALQRTKNRATRVLKSFWNWTGGWVQPNYDLSQDSVVVPLNAARLIDDLLAVHGHEILINGCFNADPHPGNVLCADGKLALIDYGQVKRITTKERMNLAKMILLVEAAVKVDPRTDPSVDPAVHAAARKAIADHGREIGMKTEKMLDDTMYEMCVVYFGRMDVGWIYPHNIIQWTDMMESRDPMGSLDDIEYLVMVNMSSLMLRGLGEMLQQYRNLSDCWAPIARKALKEEGKLEGIVKAIEGWNEAK